MPFVIDEFIDVDPDTGEFVATLTQVEEGVEVRSVPVRIAPDANEAQMFAAVRAAVSRAGVEGFRKRLSAAVSRLNAGG